MTATGLPAPTFTEIGSLPTGVTLSTGGVLSGTPTTSGTFPITITAANGVTPNATQSFTLDVDAPPAITSAAATSFTKGSAGSFTVTATGFPAPTFTEIGSLPTGVTLSTGGVLSGTPTASGSFPITITASNGVTPNATQSFTLTVSTSGVAPTITSANHATFTEGTAGTFAVTATGSPAPTFTEGGALPTGVTLSSGGVLSGTPTASGTFPIIITAANGITPNATQSFILTVSTTGVAPLITSANAATFVKGTAGTFAVTATGSPAPTFTESGALPGGVTLSSSGLLSGTATASGTFPFTITAANGVIPNATQSFTLTIDAAAAITSANHATFTEGTAGTFTVTATGFPAPTFTESGALPGGVTLSSAGLLSGTATSSGTFHITLDVTNFVGPMATQAFTLTVQPPAVGPTIQLRRSTLLVGNYNEKVSGNGWDKDSTATIFECASASYATSSCDHANAVQVALNAGQFSNAGIRLAVGVIGAHKTTCGLLGSPSCFVIVVGNSGDRVTSQALGFKVPTLSVKKTMNLPSGYIDPIHASGLPIGDNVVVRQCHAGTRGNNPGACATSNEVIGTADSHGKVQFNAAGIEILIGSAYPRGSSHKCEYGGNCIVQLSDLDNPSIVLSVPLTLAPKPFATRGFDARSTEPATAKPDAP